jgi:Tol biopolymer transport system component
MGMRKTVLLLALVGAALLLASGVALVMPKEQARAAFPGISGKIAFEKPGRDGGIYTIYFTGKHLKRIASNSYSRTKDIDVINETPSWSPNGKKIVFARNNNATTIGSRSRENIYVMNADGSNKKLVTNERSLPGDIKQDGQPAFSPSGKKIVFWRGRDLYTINSDGTNFTRLTDDGVRNTEGGPVWRPDGKKIAYDAYDSNGLSSGIFLMNSDGSSPIRIAPNLDAYSPDWSPDGTRITYARSCGRYGVMNANGSGQTVLGGSTRPHNSCDATEQTSAFSPGGGKIVFSADRDGDYDLYIINADGSGLRRLTNLPGPEVAPDWQPAQ